MHERSCIACSTPLLTPPANAASSLVTEDEPCCVGVPYCVMCKSLVVTDENMMTRVETMQEEWGGDASGRIILDLKPSFQDVGAKRKHGANAAATMRAVAKALNSSKAVPLHLQRSQSNAGSTRGELVDATTPDAPPPITTVTDDVVKAVPSTITTPDLNTFSINSVPSEEGVEFGFDDHYAQIGFSQSNCETNDLTALLDQQELEVKQRRREEFHKAEENRVRKEQLLIQQRAEIKRKEEEIRKETMRRKKLEQERRMKGEEEKRKKLVELEKQARRQEEELEMKMAQDKQKRKELELAH